MGCFLNGCCFGGPSDLPWAFTWPEGSIPWNAGMHGPIHPAQLYGVINALLLKMTSGVISGFDIHGFWAAVLGALVISVVSWFLNSFVSGQGRIGPNEVIDLKRRGDGGRWE